MAYESGQADEDGRASRVPSFLSELRRLPHPVPTRLAALHLKARELGANGAVFLEKEGRDVQTKSVGQRLFRPVQVLRMEPVGFVPAKTMILIRSGGRAGV